MTEKSISIARDYSPTPAGRYENDGPFPGEVFRDRLLIPALGAQDVVVVDLDGTAGFGSSFLEEAFGGLVRKGFSPDELRRRLRIVSSRPSYAARVWDYIGGAQGTAQPTRAITS